MKIEIRLAHLSRASATAFMSGATISGGGPRGNKTLPGRATNAARHPAFSAPNTSHACAATSINSPGATPRLRYTSRSGLKRRTASTEMGSSKYLANPLLCICALTAVGLEFVKVTMRNPAARKRSRLAGTSGCGGNVSTPCRSLVWSSGASCTPLVLASISNAPRPTVPKSV